MMNEKENDNFDSVTAHKLWKNIFSKASDFIICALY